MIIGNTYSALAPNGDGHRGGRAGKRDSEREDGALHCDRDTEESRQQVRLPIKQHAPSFKYPDGML